MKNNRGFTLVEILLAVAISGVLIAVIASLLFSSSRVIGVLQTRNQAKLESAWIELEKLSREVADSPVYPEIPFEGRTNEIRFPRFISPDKGFKTVIYSFEAGSLKRRVDGEEAQTLMSGLKNIQFSYLVSPHDHADWKWQNHAPDNMDAGNLAAVRVRAEWPEADWGYFMPGIQKTFVVYRLHAARAS